MELRPQFAWIYHVYFSHQIFQAIEDSNIYASDLIGTPQSPVCFDTDVQLSTMACGTFETVDQGTWSYLETSVPRLEKRGLFLAGYSIGCL